MVADLSTLKEWMKITYRVEQIRSCQILRCHVYSNVWRRSKIWILRIVITWVRKRNFNRHSCEEIEQQRIFGLLCVYTSIPHIRVYHLFGQHHKMTSGKKFQSGFSFENVHWVHKNFLNALFCSQDDISMIQY